MAEPLPAPLVTYEDGDGDVQICGVAARAGAEESVPDAPPCEVNGAGDEAGPPAVMAPPSEEAPREPPRVPVCFLPPPRGIDNDVAWGLGTEAVGDIAPTLQAKLAHLHQLKKQGTQFNATLARNRSFHNPHIYAKLVKWADLDERQSNYEAMACAMHTSVSWNSHREDVLADGNVIHLAKVQKAYVEAREAAQTSRARPRIEFGKGRRTRS